MAERERVSRLFAEAAAVLQGFQTQVLGFIDEGEAAMLGRSQGDLRRQEEQRSRLSRARHNLSQVPEADSVSFLQVRAAPWVRRAPKLQEEAAGGPQDVDPLPPGVHLPGQAPPLYLGTRQRQVVPDKLRPEPWALSSLTAGIPPRPLAQGVSGQPCGCVRGSLCRPWLRGQPWMELTPQPCVPHPSAGSRGPVGWRPPPQDWSPTACKGRSGPSDGSSREH